MPRKLSVSPTHKHQSEQRKPLSSQPPSQIAVVQNKPSFLGMIKEGFGFGIGSTIARNMFDTTRNSHSVTVVPAPAQEMKKEEPQTFTQCMEKTSGDYETCGHLE